MFARMTAIAVCVFASMGALWMINTGTFGGMFTGYVALALFAIIILICLLEMWEQKVTKHTPKLAVTINPETYASDVEYVSDLEFIAANAHRFHEDTVRHANLELDSRYYKQVQAMNQPDQSLIHPDHQA